MRSKFLNSNWHDTTVDMNDQNSPYRSAALGWFCRIFAVPLFLGGIYFAVLVIYSDVPPAFRLFEVQGILQWGVIAVCVSMIVASNLMRSLGRSLCSTSSLQTNEDPSVLYLRPFSSDTGIEFISPIEGTDEEALGEVLASIGSFVAIGRPGELFQARGARRAYIADDEWQESVIQLLHRSRLIVLYPGDSAGLGWEFEQVVKLADPQRVLCYIPRYPLKQRKQCYDSLQYLADQHLAHPLPKEVGEASFVWFDRNWQPCVLRPTGPTLWTRLRSVLRLRSDVPLFREALIPVFNHLEIPVPMLRPHWGEYVHGALLLLVVIVVYFEIAG